MMYFILGALLSIIFLLLVTDAGEDKRHKELIEKLDEIRCGLIDIEEEIKKR